MSNIIFSPDSLRAQVEAATGGHVTVLYDDKGYPSYMRVIPKFRYEDIGFDSQFGTGVATAFLVNGQEKSEVFIGQYLASTYDGRAVSLPGKDPRASINYDQAKSACADKGPGWHLMTMHEWAAVALWCKANGFEPRGNTDWGRAHDAQHEVALRPDGNSPGVSSGTGRTTTGGGPASWRHDGGITGIADLVGNVWEWQHLMKIVDGRVFASPDNDYQADEGDWEDTGVDLPSASSPTWNSQSTTGNELTDRLLITHAGVDLQGSIWTNTDGERLPFRGGNWRHGSHAGLGALHLSYARSYSYTSFGFRPAFVA
jgi:hypothetical protein